MQTALYPPHFAPSTAREGAVCVDVLGDKQFSQAPCSEII